MPVNPQLMTRHKLARLLPLLQLFLPVFSGVSGDVAKPGVVEPGYNRLPVKAMYSLSKAWLVVRADLPKVTVPTLLMHSRADHIVEPENSRIVLDEISSTDVTELVLERSYHVATMDYDAELIFAASTEFIEKITVSVS